MQADAEVQATPSRRAAPSWIRALRARLQADTGAPVDLIETHISWVLLAGGHAYKVKKPVRLPFVDFSSLAARRRYCDEELRLNRRLAPSLYLGVLPVCGSAEAPRLGGAGAPLDYAVQMRRFPRGALLSERVRDGRLLPRDLDRLAQRVADFHRLAPAVPAELPFGTPHRMVQPVRDVLDRLAPHADAATLATLRRWVDAHAATLAGEFAARCAGGAVRECHGDLHLANTVVDGDDVTAFDCIEFDPALRWTDVMADVGFLTMDLKAHGRADLAWRFLDAYLQRSGDYAGLQVLRYYEVYRALVRALVSSLRPDDDGPDYLACARRLAENAALAPRLMITHGLSGSGKTTVSGLLLEAAGAVRVRSDVERKRLHGLAALERSAPRGLELYTEAATRRTFERLADCARTALCAGYPAIVDAAFLRRAERQRFRALADELCVPFTILDCRADAPALRERVAGRSGDASEADVAVLERQGQTREPLDAPECAVAIEVDALAPPRPGALLARWRASTFAAKK